MVPIFKRIGRSRLSSKMCEEQTLVKCAKNFPTSTPALDRASLSHLATFYVTTILCGRATTRFNPLTQALLIELIELAGSKPID